jgi:hypothetical protein
VIKIADVQDAGLKLDEIFALAERLDLPLHIVTNEGTTKETERAAMEERIKGVVAD